jgi:hypothetical protein
MCNAVRAALRQQEHRLLEEGLHIQQLVEEFKFKQKTIGNASECRRCFSSIFLTGLLKDKDGSMKELKQLSAQSALRLLQLAGDVLACGV